MTGGTGGDFLSDMVGLQSSTLTGLVFFWIPCSSKMVCAILVLEMEKGLMSGFHISIGSVYYL